MQTTNVLIATNLAVTAAMFGVIWVVQLVHYPMLAGLESQAFRHWHSFHSRRITYLVAPLMVAELALSALLAISRFHWFTALNVGMGGGIWLATFFLSVPIHEKLSRAEGAVRLDAIRRLVGTNWVRTALYSLKVILLVVCLLTLECR